jgi:uncharacterized repeat protein (TIGR02543 family)
MSAFGSGPSNGQFWYGSSIGFPGFLFKKNVGVGGRRSTKMTPGGNITCNSSTYLYNKYKPGTGGVGASSIANRRAKNRLATVCDAQKCFPCYTTLGQYSNYTHNPNGFVPCPGTININSSTTSTLPTLSVTYNGNTNTSGTVPTDGSSPYNSGTSVTILGNSGSLAKTGFTFAGWNTAANGSGTSYSQGNTLTINANIILYARWTPLPLQYAPPSGPSAPTALSSVGGNTEAYILFTQSGTITNYEYSTDNGVTFLVFNPPQIFSPVNIKTLSSDGVTPLTNGTTYTIKLKAVNSGASSSESVSVNVVPTITSLLTSGRLIYLDATNPSSYPGSGTTWTNLDSGGLYSATLQNSPIFDNTNKWFTFDGINQIAQIAANSAINPTTQFTPFTIQIWARVNTSSPNFTSGDGLISKQFWAPSYDGYSLTLNTSGAAVLNMNGGSVNGNHGSSAGVYSNDWALYTIVVRFGGGSGSPSYAYVSTRRVVTANNNEGSMPSSTAPLQFPRGMQDTNYNFCPADVGAFYLYNTAMSQEDIIRNFDATKHTYI